MTRARPRGIVESKARREPEDERRERSPPAPVGHGAEPGRVPRPRSAWSTTCEWRRGHDAMRDETGAGRKESSRHGGRGGGSGGTSSRGRRSPGEVGSGAMRHQGRVRPARSLGHDVVGPAVPERDQSCARGASEHGCRRTTPRHRVSGDSRQRCAMSLIGRNTRPRHDVLATCEGVDVVLPRTAEYAVRAVLRVASGSPHPVRVSDIADAVDAPRNYLAKTLHVLARDGVLVATRGPGGGYRLATSPASLTLARIVAPFAAGDARRCLLRPTACGAESACAVHDRWASAARAIDRFFCTTTVADLLPHRRAQSLPLSSHSRSR